MQEKLIGSFLLQQHQNISMSLCIIIIFYWITCCDAKNNERSYVTNKTISPVSVAVEAHVIFPLIYIQYLVIGVSLHSAKRQSSTIDFKCFLTVVSLVGLTLLSWRWGGDPTSIASITGIKWGSELPAHHTIISIVWSSVASNPCAMACNIWWVSEVFSV